MSSYIDASVTSGLVSSADLSGVLELKSGGVTKATVDANGLTPVGDFKFNSGYGSSATAYGCRAWVNFNGTGTVAIRASGNVSSITDGGTGIYTVNFNTAMPDANYSASCDTFYTGGSGTATNAYTSYYSSTGVTVVTGTPSALVDSGTVVAAVFR